MITEMDKARDVSRGACRLSPAKRQIRQSGHKLLSGLGGVGGDPLSLEKPKKERLRRLSSVSRASSSFEDCEMGCDVDDEPPSQSPSVSAGGTSKRFKLPKKLFDDCNGVDHALVPRKLRSAMKKRNRESIFAPLPDSKNLNHVNCGNESPKRDGVKKYKLNVKQDGSGWSPKQIVSGSSITKDEEEVVETLNSLARMLPDNDTANKSQMDEKSLEASPSTLPGARESLLPGLEVTKEDLNSIWPSRTAEAAIPSDVERSPGKTLSEPANEKPLCDVVNFGIPSEPSQDTGLEQSKQQENSLPERKQELSLGPATPVGSQPQQQHSIKEFKKRGQALWPGLSMTVLHGAGSRVPSVQCFSDKIPAWKGSTVCSTIPGSFENGYSTGKVSEVAAYRRSWKRCTAHVYISRLIQVLQMTGTEDRLPLQPSQLKLSEGSNQGVIMAASNFNGVTNALNGVISASSIGNVAVENKPNEAKSGILQHKRVNQGQQHDFRTPAASTSQQQCVDFLSLSAGVGRVGANRSINRAGKGLEAVSQLQGPYLHSLMQHRIHVPSSLPQSRHSSSAYPDQLSAAAATQQLQLPQYLGSPIALTKQQQQHHHWAAQLAAQYRSVGTSASMVPFLSLQNGRKDFPLLIPRDQVIIPPPPLLDELSSKFDPLSLLQQQPQLIALTSSVPPAGVKRQDHHLSSVYENPGAGLHASGALPLQLLCNERL